VTQIQVTNVTRRTELGANVRVADRLWMRVRGLIGRAISPGEGLLIVPCNGVHTFGMRYSLDVAFLDKAGRVVAVNPVMQPNRMSKIHRGAHAVLEVPAGTLAQTGTVAGDKLLLQPK
jgi:uncharacterized protein